LVHATGDGLKMCEQVGAQLVNLDQPLLPSLGDIPDPANAERALAHVDMEKYPGAIWVDLDGNRVINEDVGSRTPPARMAMQNAPGMVLHVIIDDKVKNENPPIFAKWFLLPERDWNWFDEKAGEGIIIKKSDTIEGLGELTGINAAGLKATIEKWNGFVESGKDLDFGRKDLQYKLENPPFYAVKVIPSVVISTGGPAVNDRQQVLDETGKIIHGLYAAGEVTGYRAFGTGGSNMGCIVFGKQAGIMAAQYALYQNR
jgi:fumarate reductase flavoprotein subunit